MKTETSINHVSANSIQGAVSGSVISRPILFSTDIRAILDGKKTQTRRTKGFSLVNQHPDDFHLQSIESYGYTFNGAYKDQYYVAQLFNNEKWQQTHIKCPYGVVGDLFWVKETWNSYNENFYGLPDKEVFLYKANGTDINSTWKPSIFMPREACRIELRITNVKVERLQSISEEDARCEGVKYDLSLEFNQYLNYEKGIYQCQTAVESFKSLWSEINGQKSWSENPFVWVITFERVEPSKHYR